jgi:hypothetical protein
MYLSSELLHQLISDRQQDRHSAASAQRAAEPSQARRRIARSLRRAADRLDASASTVTVSNALPGRGF